MSTRKRALPTAGQEGEGPIKGKPVEKKAKPLDAKKFGGMTEEEVCKMLLPDHMGPGLDIIFVSLQPLGEAVRTLQPLVTLIHRLRDPHRWGSIRVSIPRTWATITATQIITSVSGPDVSLSDPAPCVFYEVTFFYSFIYSLLSILSLFTLKSKYTFLLFS